MTESVETIGQEIVTDAKAFIQNAETVLTDDLEAGWAWLKSELAKLEPTVVADLKTAVALAFQDALTSGTTGSVVTDTLNVLARDGQAVLAQVKTDVVSAVVGLTTAKAS